MTSGVEAPGAPAAQAPVYALAAPVQVLWLVGGLFGAVFLTAAAAFVDFRVLRMVQDWPFAPGTATVTVLILTIVRAFAWPPLAYRAWRFSLREHDVWMRYGVLWRTRRSVPRVRIQHVDVESGPIERMLGLANLVVYTAGTGDADARIPGLRLGSAEWLRDELLPRRANGAVLRAPAAAQPARAFAPLEQLYAAQQGDWPNTPHPGLSPYRPGFYAVPPAPTGTADESA